MVVMYFFKNAKTSIVKNTLEVQIIRGFFYFKTRYTRKQRLKTGDFFMNKKIFNVHKHSLFSFTNRCAWLRGGIIVVLI